MAVLHGRRRPVVNLGVERHEGRFKKLLNEKGSIMEVLPTIDTEPKS
jgi:hypothetical protein